jgi:SAM-dependent methyltransferase
MNNPIEHNRRIWDERARRHQTHTQPVSDQDFENARALVDECGWLPPSLKGLRVLCLAAGGGRHAPLLAFLGADVTVVDISGQMLDLDRKVSVARNLSVRIVQTSMDNLSMLPRAAFDLILQPVSTCYVPDISAVYLQVAQISAPGALYISQHKQPASLQGSSLPGPLGYVMTHPYYRSTPLPPEINGLEHREAGTLEFIHRWEDLVGGLCRRGFVVEDLVEPRHADATAPPGSFAHRSHSLPPYVTIKARRLPGEQPRAALWVPGMFKV